MTTTIFRDLPMDLVEEILCYIPTTYLKRLGSTCKQWNCLLNGDSRFARKHIDKAPKQFLVLMLKAYRICPAVLNLHGSVEVKSDLSLLDSHSKYSAQFDISRVFHCDGLLLCTSEDELSRFMVWNPFTGETRWFQPRNRGVVGDVFLGYYQEGNHKSYKILSFCHHRKEYEIYEFSSSSWRTIDNITAPGLSIHFELNTSLKENTYWFARDGTEAQRNISLLKFDFSTEKSARVPLPYQSHVFACRGLSVVREDKLSVLLQRESTSNTEIWVTNKIDETTQVVSWNKVLTLDLSPDLQLVYEVSFLLDEEKKVVMICDRWFDLDDETETKKKDLIYIVGEDDEEVRQVEFGVDIGDFCGSAILSYVPSLVQIEQAEGKRKRGNL